MKSKQFYLRNLEKKSVQSLQLPGSAKLFKKKSARTGLANAGALNSGLLRSGLTHGGILRNQRKGRCMRPLSTKEPLHLVFKINRYLEQACDILRILN